MGFEPPPTTWLHRGLTARPHSRRWAVQAGRGTSRGGVGKGGPVPLVGASDSPSQQREDFAAGWTCKKKETARRRVRDGRGVGRDRGEGNEGPAPSDHRLPCRPGRNAPLDRQLTCGGGGASTTGSPTAVPAGREHTVGSPTDVLGGRVSSRVTGYGIPKHIHVLSRILHTYTHTALSFVPPLSLVPPVLSVLQVRRGGAGRRASWEREGAGCTAGPPTGVRAKGGKRATTARACGCTPLPLRTP